MADNQLNISRRQTLGVLGTIGAASAGAGIGTSAIFSDQEQFENNQLTAGEVDMLIGFEEHYSNWSPDENDGLNGTVSMTSNSTVNNSTIGLPTQEPINGSPLIVLQNASDAKQFLNNTEGESPDVGDGIQDTYPEGFDATSVEKLTDPCSSDQLVNAGERPTIQLSDVKPGDFGEITFSFALCTNPGFVWAIGRLVDASENGVTESESDDPDEDGDADSTDPSDVELLDEIQTAIWIDDGNNYQNENESLIHTGSLRETLTALAPSSSFGNIDREFGNVEQSQKGVLLTGDISASEGGGQGANCFAANETHSIVFAWWLPVNHANEIQTDSVTFDLGFYTEQCRHNTVSTGIEGFQTFSSASANFEKSGETFVIEASGSGMFE